MKRLLYLYIALIVLAPVNSFAGFFGASNYWECILEEMPGVKNDSAAAEVIEKCREDFPNIAEVKKKSPLFGVKTAGDCLLEYGKNVASLRGRQQIQAACYKLYPSR